MKAFCRLPVLVLGLLAGSGAFADNWNPPTRAALDALMVRESTNGHAYAVFDFDNTTVLNDIEETCLTRMIETLAFKISTNDLYRVLTTGIPDVNRPLDPARPSLTVANLAADIADAYAELRASGRPAAELHAGAAWRAFASKSRYLYDGICDTFGATVGYPWVTFAFTGMTPNEVQAYGTDSIRHGISLGRLKRVTWTCPSERAGRAGVVSVSFAVGLAYTPELVALYHDLRAHGISVYIVSASFRDLVLAASGPGFGLDVPPDHVFGYRLRKDGSGRYLPAYETNYPQPQGPGKVETIRRFIRPRHGGADPVLVCGDSMGDYDMLTAFPGLQAGLIFNRNPSNPKLAALVAKARIRKPDARPLYLLQGRDEPRAALRPSPDTVFLP